MYRPLSLKHSPRIGQAAIEVIDLNRQNTFGDFQEIVGDGEGVYLSHLPPCTSLLVRTLNSRYRVVITRPPEVRVQGGLFFPEPTAAWLVGSRSVPGDSLKVGWIGIGLRIELRSGSQRVVTSPVRAIMPHPPED